MKVKQLIAALHDLEHTGGEAHVAFVPDGGDPVMIEGGILRTAQGEPVLVLSPIKLDQVGGF